MRNNNFRKLFAGVCSYKFFSDPIYYLNNTLVNVNGKPTSYNFKDSGPGSDYVISVGTGTTPPTENDYKLENAVSLTLASQTLVNDKDHTISIIESIKNQTSEAVTITEVALTIQRNPDHFIISRDLITPITIPSGEMRTIQYNIEF